MTPSGRVGLEDRRQRGADFLGRSSDLARLTRQGPYARLLGSTGCLHGDVARLVRLDGVEEARTLSRAIRVYLTVEEFKGRRPMLRGNLRFTIGPGRRRLRAIGSDCRYRPAAARKCATVAIDMAPSGHGPSTCLDYEARGGLD